MVRRRERLRERDTRMDSGTILRVAGTWVLLACLQGCSVPIAADLGENQANQAIVALEGAGVYASKEPDPTSEGRWRLVVPQGDSVAAVSALTEQNLPARESPGVLEAMDQGSLVPSRTLEHAKWLAGTAGDLESSLRAVDGVLSARVHLAAPSRDALELGQNQPEPSASVLIRYRGATPPIAQGDVQRLVAGAVPGLSQAAVNVILSAVAPAREHRERLLAQLGPVTVTRASLTALKGMFGAVIALNLLLLALAGWFWTRARRAQLRLAELDKGEAAAGEP